MTISMQPFVQVVTETNIAMCCVVNALMFKTL